MKVTLLIPVLNEIHGMREIMPRIRPEWVDELIIADGGSTDGTLEYAKEHGYRVIPQRRKGIRYEYMEALAHASGDILVTFSPDGNSIPELIPPLIAKIKEGYDMVIVSRYKAGAKSYDDSAITALANKVFTFTINVLYRANYTDTLCIFRAYRRALVEELDLDDASSYWPEEALFRTVQSWEVLLTIRCAKRRLKVAEIPGDEPARIGGPKAVHWQWGLANIVEVFREVLFWR